MPLVLRSTHFKAHLPKYALR